MRKEQFEYHEEAIYKWRLLNDGYLEKLGPIHFYNVHENKGKAIYRALFGETRHCFRTDDFNVVRHDRYYSFDNDDKKATLAFAQCFQNKAAIAHIEWECAQRKYEEFLKKNKVFS